MSRLEQATRRCTLIFDEFETNRNKDDEYESDFSMSRKPTAILGVAGQISRVMTFDAPEMYDV